jgi:hypothetical protein
VAIDLHPAQSTVYRDQFVENVVRYATCCCTRGFGKSYLGAAAAITAVFELMELPSSVLNKTVYIIAPTYDQVVDIYFPLIYYELGIENYCEKASKDTGRFLFPSNVELRLLSYESVERMRGKGAYLVVWDEVSSCRKGIHPRDAWEGVIQPCITTRWSAKRAKEVGAKNPGRALIIGTPDGYNYFQELCTKWETDDEWKFYHYDYTSSPFLDPEEIEKLKHLIDPVKFASEYLATFEDSGNSVFYCFDRKRHVSKELLDIQEDEEVHCAIDFNVGLQCTSVFVVRGGQMHFLEEFKGHPDTETLAIAISERYDGHKISAYPDPSGRARKTSAPVGRTDFSILESYGIRCLAKPKAPPIVDSVAAVNRKLMTAAGDIGIYIHPRCSGLIASLERTKWVDKNPDTATIDKSEGVEHFSDGVRYAVEYLYPVFAGTKRTARGHKF